MAKCITELDVYRKSYRQAMQVFEMSKRFPPEERFALTSQIRRSSRSVCQNLREAWAKRRYAAHFVSKLTDCDGENAETETSLQFALDCGYIKSEEFVALAQLNRDVGNMLGAVLADTAPFLLSGNGSVREDAAVYDAPSS